MIIEVELDNLLFVFERKYEWDEFRGVAKSRPSSYADELIERIYHCLFSNSRNLQEEYAKYYAIEYPNLAQFLYWRYAVDEDTAQTVADMVGDGGFLGYGRDNIGMLTDDSVKKVLERLLSELEETGNEDQN